FELWIGLYEPLQLLLRGLTVAGVPENDHANGRTLLQNGSQLHHSRPRTAGQLRRTRLKTEAAKHARNHPLAHEALAAGRRRPACGCGLGALALQFAVDLVQLSQIELAQSRILRDLRQTLGAVSMLFNTAQLLGVAFVRIALQPQLLRLLEFIARLLQFRRRMHIYILLGLRGRHCRLRPFQWQKGVGLGSIAFLHLLLQCLVLCCRSGHARRGRDGRIRIKSHTPAQPRQHTGTDYQCASHKCVLHGRTSLSAAPRASSLSRNLSTWLATASAWFRTRARRTSKRAASTRSWMRSRSCAFGCRPCRAAL